jgi:hypothetical protein
MLTIKSETEYQQRGRDNTNPKGLFGRPDPTTTPIEDRRNETRADIPLRGVEYGLWNRRYHVDILLRLTTVHLLRDLVAFSLS